VQGVFDDARQLRDGRWLFVQVESERDVEDNDKLLAVKRRPRALTPAG
jgi:predicted RNA-binding protein with PUA-like domain